MKPLRYALEDSRRDWRLTDVRLLWLALTVAVLAVTSVSFFTDRVDRAMRQQATALLGADIVIQSSRPIADDYRILAKAADLQIASVTEFPSVAVAADNTLLTQVKTVTAHYPLRGKLETTAERGTTESTQPATLASGHSWVDERVLLQLGLELGDTLDLGDKTFTIDRIITAEPDRAGAIFQLAPRILIPQQDLAATRLLTPASRASFRLLLAGKGADVQRFSEQIEANLKPYETLQTVTDGRPEITGALSNATRFTTLASMLTVVLSGAAIALAAQGFCRREINRVAILRTLGAQRQQLWFNYCVRLGVLLLAATLVGSAFGLLSQQVLSNILADWLQIVLPAASFSPLLTGFGTAALTLAGFALPPVLQLVQTPPMHILRANDQQAQSSTVWISLLCMAVSMMLLLAWQAGDLKLAAFVFGGISAALATITTITWLLLRWLRKREIAFMSHYRQGLINLGRQPRRATLLITAFATTVLALTLLGGVRQDLMQSWKNTIPDHAPNYFLVNIQPQNLPALRDFLNRRELDNYNLYPMIRGRLLSINGDAVSAKNYDDERAQRLVSREFNLSAAAELPTANTVIAGTWFEDNDQNGLSVEEDIAETLGFNLGDELIFDIAGQQLQETITSIREVKWDTMQPNFFVLTAHKQQQDFPATWITSVYVPPSDIRFTADLVKAFPAVTALDVQAIVSQIQQIMAQASRAVSYVFLFTLLAAVVVLIASIQTQRLTRKQEIAVLKSIGATRQQLRRNIAVEFTAIGLLAGALGSLLATMAGWLLATFVFELDYHINISQIIIATIISGVLVASIGLWVIRSMLKTSPMALLQEL